jgi:FAD/FMN-containing dehydrogenase
MSTSNYGASFVSRLDGRLQGTAIGPDHPDYDGARRGHNQSFDYRPALIARCVDADDVSTAVRFAAAEGLELAVRGGGHSLAGFCSLDGGLVIDLAAMRSVQVDAGARTAAVGGGATAGDLDRATHEFGLATPSATVSTVGMSGFTLGGGIGHLVRAHGLAADNLIGAEVVLADGRRVRADEESEPELLWALRGGGGNFGVVTELRYRLHPVRTVIGGPMLWELAEAPEVLELYLRWLPEQPNEVSAFLAVMVVPPAEPFPEAIRLRPVCALVWCNTAAPEHARGALDAFRAAAPAPLLDAVTELPYPALQSAFDPIAQIGTHNHVSSQFYSSLPGEAAAEFVRFGETTPHWLSFTHLYPLSGAAAGPRNDDTAWAWRDAAFAHMFLGSTDEPSHDNELREWARGFADALAPYGIGGAYSNLLMDEGPDAARDCYGDNYERLSRVKAAYDPDNLLHHNQNIAPTSS